MCKILVYYIIMLYDRYSSFLRDLNVITMIINKSNRICPLGPVSLSLKTINKIKLNFYPEVSNTYYTTKIKNLKNFILFEESNLNTQNKNFIIDILSNCWEHYDVAYYYKDKLYEEAQISTFESFENLLNIFFEKLVNLSEKMTPKDKQQYLENTKDLFDVKHKKGVTNLDC